MKLWLAVVLTACVAAAADTKSKAPGVHARTPAPPARKPAAPPAQSDAAVETAIRARFAKSKIAADNFHVRVQGGVATLEGRTDVIQRKGVATRLARSAGARDVVNRIETSEKAREKAAANLAKGRRRAQIKRDEAGRR